MTDSWNRCDVCGRFIPIKDFIEEKAVRKLITPDSHRSEEEWETLCPKHRDGTVRIRTGGKGN
jgi:hypothetical protein